MNERHTVLSFDLPDRLDSAAVSVLRGHVALHPSTGTIVLEAGRVTRLDPVGILKVWDFCRDQTAKGVRVEIRHLHPAMIHRLRAHPVLHFLGSDDRLFQDPFATLAASDR